MLAPIILFVYNRPYHTSQTLKALEQNALAQESELYIYADGSKANADPETIDEIRKVRNLIKNDWKFKQIHLIEREKNWGLADNIVDGVTTITQQHGKVIVLEDDIVTSPGFLKYMNQALDLYENHSEVMHISGYMFPVKKALPSTFFYNTASCWGWGTWASSWKYFEPSAQKLAEEISAKKLIETFNINNSYRFYEDLLANANQTLKTWAVRWYASMFLKNGYSLHPYPSLTNNIGHDGTGENSQKLDQFSWRKLAEHIEVVPIEISPSERAIALMVDYYTPKVSGREKVKTILKKIIPKSIIHRFKKSNKSV